MKTLVIHPKDHTTDFLCDVYKGKDWDIRRNNLDEKLLFEEAKSYDRLVLLGHGCIYGLFTKEGMNFSKRILDGGLLVNENWVELLRQKEITSIWCLASTFAEDYNLSGFYSGMFISEPFEADYCGVNATEDEIERSNYIFSNALNRHIFKQDVFEKVVEEYIGESDLIRYNRSRLHFKAPTKKTCLSSNSAA